jgi:hypothetical protein
MFLITRYGKLPAEKYIQIELGSRQKNGYEKV